jgi:CDP-6-deoxy-D-xylo-4-hexulose-3-dehydrase
MISENAPFTKGEITSFLEAQGVENRPIVAGNLARQPVAELFPAVFDRTYFGADAVHKNGFYLGLNPFVTDEMMERLIQLIDRFVRERE